MSGYHPLTVARVQAETADATSLVFQVPLAQRELFRWLPGQHLNLRLHLEGEELRRSYSISSSPLGWPTQGKAAPDEELLKSADQTSAELNEGSELRITVKRVPDGRVSTYLNEAVRPGDVIEAAPPSGSFCVRPHADARRTYYFFAAGSGITPLFSMLCSVIEAEPHSRVNLLYGNRSDRSIIFCEALAHLAEAHPRRLRVIHTLTRSRWISHLEAWKGPIGREAIRRFIEAVPPYAQDTQYFVCGPGNMNDEVRATLMALEVPKVRIHSESYGGRVEGEDTTQGVDAQAEVELDEQRLTIRVARDRTVLQALLEAGHSPPYSCQAGVCSSCRAQLLQGTVHMRVRAALEEREIANGTILSCQAVPTSERIELRFSRQR